MKIKLIDNAIDSLLSSIKFFYLLCEEESNISYMKLTITSLHNALELLIKSILANENELLIYDNLTDKEIVEGIRLRRLCKGTVTLDEILIKNKNVKTVSYSSLIKMYCSIFDSNERTRIVLEKLGHLRNSITHFGIDKSDELHEVINIIYESMDIVLNVLYPDLLEIHELFTYNDIIDQLESFIEGGYEYRKELCLKDEKCGLKRFAHILKEVIEGSTFIGFLIHNECIRQIQPTWIQY